MKTPSNRSLWAQSHPAGTTFTCVMLIQFTKTKKFPSYMYASLWLDNIIFLLNWPGHVCHLAPEIVFLKLKQYLPSGPRNENICLLTLSLWEANFELWGTDTCMFIVTVNCKPWGTDNVHQAKYPSIFFFFQIFLF